LRPRAGVVGMAEGVERGGGQRWGGEEGRRGEVGREGATAGFAGADGNAEDLDSEILQLENDLKLLERLSNVGEYDTAVQDAVEAAVLAVRPLPPIHPPWR